MSNDAKRSPAKSRNTFEGCIINPIAPTGILVVVGMTREARAARPLGRVVVGGAALAHALTQDATAVISFGLCGGLDSGLAPGDLVIGTHVLSGSRTLAVDDDWMAALAQALPDATLGGVAGSDAIVGDAAAKAALRSTTGAIAADMESHHAAESARDAGVPFAILRAVSDGATESLPLCAQMGFRPDGSVNIGAVVRGLLARPSEFPALMRTARNAGTAMTALADAANRVSAKL